MDIDDLRSALRGGWSLILAVTFMCLVAALTYTLMTEPRYESKTQLFVAAGRDLSASRVPSYARLVETPSITAEVVRDLGLPGTGRDLARRVSGYSRAGEVEIGFSVRDSDPARAQRIGQALANKLVAYVPRLERSRSSRFAAVRLYVTSPPSLPTEPVTPNAWMNLATGGFLGLLLGLVAAIARRLLDRRIWNPGDLPVGPGYEVLAAVPVDDGSENGDGAMGRLSPGQADAMRALRTNLRLLEADDPPGSIVVTSSTGGEGTSDTTLGLAVAMAEAGSHVILVEADLRRPQLTNLLGLPPAGGVCSYLVRADAGEPDLQRVYGGPVGGGLQVLVAGAVPSNPSELLSSPRMPELIRDLQPRCDVVLVDAAPLLSATESVLVAAAADGVIVVVDVRRATRPQLDHALARLGRADAHVLGLVVNGITGAGWEGPRRGFAWPADAPGAARASAATQIDSSEPATGLELAAATKNGEAAAGRQVATDEEAPVEEAAEQRTAREPAAADTAPAATGTTPAPAAADTTPAPAATDTTPAAAESTPAAAESTPAATEQAPTEPAAPAPAPAEPAAQPKPPHAPKPAARSRRTARAKPAARTMRTSPKPPRAPSGPSTSGVEPPAGTSEDVP